MVKKGEPWPYRGRVVWLTAEQGGRPSVPQLSGRPYAVLGFVPPATALTGSYSFYLWGWDPAALTSAAEGAWLFAENAGDRPVVPGTVIVVTEVHKIVAYFHVEEVTKPSLA
jgi:hypothetical protein